MRINPILRTDSYKASHFLQYPPKTEGYFGYIEARKPIKSVEPFSETVFFGLQIFLKEYLSKPITKEDIDEAEEFFITHGEPFDRGAWEYILKEYDGYMPITIRAPLEGSVIEEGNVLCTIECTDSRVFWIGSYIETSLLRSIWYPSTVATNSRECKKVIYKYMQLSSDRPEEGMAFKLHDFGARGVSSSESAGIGGAAHLVNFMGSDTIEGALYANKYYNEKMAGFSIPAAEHSTITAWGKDHEVDAYRNMLKQFGKPGAILACVSDSYDIFNACEHIWGEELKEEVIKSGATVIIRPDCYDDKTEVLTSIGWKLFKDLNKFVDRVAQFDNGIVSFVNPIRYIEEDYTGNMICFKSPKVHLNLVVTPNHNMIRYNKHRRIYQTEAAETIKYNNYNYIFPTSGRKDGELVHLTPYEQLLIAYQADGRYRQKAKNPGILGGRYIIEFNFAKKRKIDKLLSICKEGGFDYKVVDSSRIYSKINPKWSNQSTIYVYTDKPPIKDFSWIKLDNVNYTWCKEFIDEVSNWDSTIRNPNRLCYSNTNYNDALIVQTIAMLAGYKTTYAIYKETRSEKFSDSHLISICKNIFGLGGQHITKEVVPYSGKIYCVTVPSGMIIVKRDGQVAVSGNSGDPSTTVTRCLHILDDKFGSVVNNKGYKVLNCVRVIQGDGININTIKDICKMVTEHGFSMDNVNFGMGGALLQHLNRDTLRFAMKCSAIKIDGGWHDVSKDPITDPGKKSKTGIISLYRERIGHGTASRYVTMKISEYEKLMESNNYYAEDMLEIVYCDGNILRDQTFEEVRKLASL